MRRRVRCITMVVIAAFAIGCGARGEAQRHYTFEVVPFKGTAMSNQAVMDPFEFDPVTFGQIGVLHGFDGSTTTIKLPGWFDTVANDVNSRGDVVGGVDMVDDSFNLTALSGFIQRANGTAVTYVYPGSAFTLFDACNDAGTILGEQFDAALNDHQFLLHEGGRLTNLSFPGFEDVIWTDLNNAETLLSSRFDPVSGGQIGLLAHDSVVNSFAVPGASDTLPARINNRGDVAGTYNVQSGEFPFLAQHGFVRNAQGRIDTVDFGGQWPSTETLNGMTFSFVGSEGTSLSAINDRGQVLGAAFALYVFEPSPGQVFLLIDSQQFIASPDS